MKAMVMEIEELTDFKHELELDKDWHKEQQELAYKQKSLDMQAHIGNSLVRQQYQTDKKIYGAPGAMAMRMLNRWNDRP